METSRLGLDVDRYNSYTMTDFDYDPAKNTLNQERHGLDFRRAQELWETTHVIIPAKDVEGESRYAILGKIDGRVYVAIFTKRHKMIRLISCHRADGRWEKIYARYIHE